MATFIADFIFGKRDQRPRSRPSPAQRLLGHLRASVRPQPQVVATEVSSEADTRGALARSATRSRAPGDGLAG